MAKKAERTREQPQPRPFWSGVIAFGLVSIPVSVFTANRGKSVSLKMVDAQGTRLRRRYFCERENKALARDEIVRGYPVDKSDYIVVKDRELEALAPEKSREIDLRRFVSISQIDPIYFQRAYFLVPEGGGTKAYRLLAKSMEEQGRAGIATFVMRGKEYLVTIIAEQGILRLETLRFADEIRSPQEIGLPEREQADSKTAADIKKSIEKRSKKQMNRDDLADRYMQRLQELVSEKHRQGRDVAEAPEETGTETEEDEDKVIDMMQVLKERLEGKSSRGGSGSKTRKGKARKTTAKKAAGKKRSRSRAGARPLENLSKDALYREAVDRHVAGRSTMSKRELIDALRQNRARAR